MRRSGSLLVVKRKNHKEPKDALSADTISRNFGRCAFSFQVIFLFSSERRCFCRKRVFKQVFGHRETLFQQKRPLSILYYFSRKYLFETLSLSAIGRKRKILFRLPTCPSLPLTPSRILSVDYSGGGRTTKRNGEGRKEGRKKGGRGDFLHDAGFARASSTASKGANAAEGAAKTATVFPSFQQRHSAGPASG